AALDVFEKEPLPPDSPLLDPEIADRCRLFHHFASGAQITRLDVDPDKGMAGRCVQGLIDVLESNYGGDPTKMPYVVNKEAFQEMQLNAEPLKKAAQWVENYRKFWEGSLDRLAAYLEKTNKAAGKKGKA